MFIQPVNISDNFRFPSKEVIWSEKEPLKWGFSMRDRNFFCVKGDEVVTEIKLSSIETSKSMNNALLFVYKNSGRLPMARLAKAMNKACKAFGVDDFQGFLSLNDDTPTPWMTDIVEDDN